MKKRTQIMVMWLMVLGVVFVTSGCRQFSYTEPQEEPTESEPVKITANDVTIPLISSAVVDTSTDPNTATAVVQTEFANLTESAIIASIIEKAGATSSNPTEAPLRVQPASIEALKTASNQTRANYEELGLPDKYQPLEVVFEATDPTTQEVVTKKVAVHIEQEPLVVDILSLKEASSSGFPATMDLSPGFGSSYTIEPMLIDWGDGSPVEYIEFMPPTLTHPLNRVLHEYAESSEYTLTISALDGVLSGIALSGLTLEYPVGMNNNIASWGDALFLNPQRLFTNSGAAHSGEETHYNMQIPTEGPNIAGDCTYMFQGSPAFNQDISNWDVSKVTLMTGMFQSTQAFNQDLSGWDVSNVSYYDGFDIGASAWTKPRPNFP